MVLSAVFVAVSAICILGISSKKYLKGEVVLIGVSNDIKCSMDESTGSALRDLRKDASPGVIPTEGGAMTCALRSLV